MQTFNDRMVETGGRTTGFDYLRIGLAVAVVMWHTIPLSYGRAVGDIVMHGPLRPIVAFILPTFFALSGFLVAGSLDRTRSLFRFGSLRALRIVPALAVEVVLSALILGPLLTVLPLGQYFADHHFRMYFFNVMGWIHFQLPGVFQTNPVPDVVNGQLWTIPFELECYAALAALAAVGIVRRPWLFLLTVLGLLILIIARDARGGGLADATGAVSGRLLVVAFLAGVLLHRFRDRVAYSWPLFGAALVALVLLLEIPRGDYLAPFASAYVVGFLGLQSPRANVLVKFGDLSYGVFLYGFAVQQVVASLGTWTHHWYINAAITLPAVTAFAAFSWYVIEKPALGLRRHLHIFDKLDGAIGAVEQRVAGGLASSPLGGLMKLSLAEKFLRPS